MKFKKNIEDSYEDVQPKKWFEDLQNYPPIVESTLTDQEINSLKDEAKQCYNSEVANYNIKNSKKSSNYQWMKTIMSKGTLSDKIASHTVAIQDNPLHNLEILKNFIGMVKVAKKKDCLSVIDALTDLFLEDLLIPNRKLKYFNQKPLSILNELTSGNAVSRRKILSLWYFENELKELFNTFIDSLNTVAHDTVDSNKEKAISSMFKLLSGNPEQEKKLLAFLVNKLGDPSQKVASKAIYCLEQLLMVHSNMQNVVLNDVEKLLFRSNVSTRTQYYSLCFLSQFYLSHEENEVAKKLIDVYFAFFKACVKKGEIDSRMMSALLMGVNRAYPYAKLENDKVSEHLDTLYKVVHLANFNVSLHALNLLYQVSDYSNNVTDRFYSALYKKLFDPQLISTTHQAMLLSLVYKALLKDNEVNRVKAFVKRLLQICLSSTPSFACGILYLTSQLLSKKKEARSIIKKKSGINFEDDDDDEEHYKDAPKIEEDDEVETKEEIIVKTEPRLENPSWFHQKLTKKNTGNTLNSYSPFTRNPLYSGAERSAYFELDYLRKYFHPSVSLFATQILNGEHIKYQGDPLKDFTLIKFLDRFVFKNPKRFEDVKKGSHPTFGQRKSYKPKGLKSLPVVSSSYINCNEGNVPADEKFLYAYLHKKYSAKMKKKDDDDDDSDLESVASEEFEEMLDKMGAFKGDDDEDLDFMNDIGESLKQSDKSKKRKAEDDNDDDEDLSDESGELSEVDGDEELEMEDEDKELLEDLDDDDDDEEEIVFDESDEEQPTKNKKNVGMNSIFASAEEFATLLEDEGTSKRKPGSGNIVSNKDKAATKQIDWEEKRHQWMSGYNKAIGKKGKKFKNKGKPQQKHKKFKS